jgi:hypothetical protein
LTVISELGKSSIHCRPLSTALRISGVPDMVAVPLTSMARQAAGVAVTARCAVALAEAAAVVLDEFAALGALLALESARVDFLLQPGPTNSTSSSARAQLA